MVTCEGEIVTTTVLLFKSSVMRLCGGSAVVVRQSSAISGPVNDFRFARIESPEDAAFIASSEYPPKTFVTEFLPPPAPRLASGCIVVVLMVRFTEDAAVDKLHPPSVKSFADVGPETETCPNSVMLSGTWLGVDGMDVCSVERSGR